VIAIDLRPAVCSVHSQQTENYFNHLVQSSGLLGLSLTCEHFLASRWNSWSQLWYRLILFHWPDYSYHSFRLLQSQFRFPKLLYKFADFDLKPMSPCDPRPKFHLCVRRVLCYQDFLAFRQILQAWFILMNLQLHVLPHSNASHFATWFFGFLHFHEHPFFRYLLQFLGHFLSALKRPVPKLLTPWLLAPRFQVPRLLAPRLLAPRLLAKQPLAPRRLAPPRHLASQSIVIRRLLSQPIALWHLLQYPFVPRLLFPRHLVQSEEFLDLV